MHRTDNLLPAARTRKMQDGQQPVLSVAPRTDVKHPAALEEVVKLIEELSSLDHSKVRFSPV
jgi:hypothetical protein